MDGARVAQVAAQDDLQAFAAKVKAGANSAITQMFFNTDTYFRFVDEAYALGVDIPIVPGIMPITNSSGIIRFADNCGTEIPRWMRPRLQSFGDDTASIKAFGLDVITDLCDQLRTAGVPVVLMHSIETPITMQDDPRYEDVLLDVYDALAARLAVTEAAGIARDRLAIDPGIGFGKTLEHNLALLARLSVFHDLGVPVLLGASRKRFIGTIGAEAEAARRMPGSLAVALAGVAQGMQMIRVHDVAETRQALRLWQAATRGY